MNNFKWSYFETRADAKARAIHNCVRHDLWQPAAEMGRLKHVLKNSADVFPGALVCVQAECAMPKIKRPNVIQPEDMIGMTMRDEHCIQMLESDS